MRLKYIAILLFLPFLAVSQPDEIPSDQESVTRGRQLFMDHCDRCHQLGRQEIGPSLSSIVDKRPVGWLMNFIQSSQGVISSGDEYAVHLYRSYNNMVMPDFMELTDADRMDILAYIKAESLGEEHSDLLDSLQRSNSQMTGKEENRYSDVTSEDPNYYTLESDLEIPRDAGSIRKGKAIFEAQCNVCHQLDRRTIGPALASVTDRRPLPWLLDFLNSPQSMMQQGDDYTIFLVKNYPLIMPDFTFLSQDDKLSVLAYIRNASGADTHTAGVNANAKVDYGEEDTTARLKSGSAKTGDMDEIGYNDDGGFAEGTEDGGRSVNTPAALIMGAVVLMIGILAWRVFRK